MENQNALAGSLFGLLRTVQVFCGATSIFQTLFRPYQWFTSSARLSRRWSGCNPDQKMEIDLPQPSLDSRRQLWSRFSEKTISKIRKNLGLFYAINSKHANDFWSRRKGEDEEEMLLGS